MQRNEVYKLIDGEREYQQSVWPGHKHGSGAYLSYMSHYLRNAIDVDAKEDATGEKHFKEAKGAMRKFAALGVACMEDNGIVYRQTQRSSWRRKLDDLLGREELLFTQGITARKLVYDAIDQERNYQESVWFGPYMEFSEELTLLRHYLVLADEAWTNYDGELPALNVIRKLVAIAVRCLEVHGAPARYSKAA